MKSPQIKDFCILGAGIAGLSLADALQTTGYTVTVIEKNDIASGASGTPGALVNPATGRRATKSWKAEQCYRAIRQNLEKVQAFGEELFFQNNGLLRPALSEKMVKKMRNQFDKTSWPEGWCLWQTETEINNRHPTVNCVGGGLWLPIGLTVDVDKYLQAYANYLTAQGVHIQTHCEVEFHRKNQCWKINTAYHRFRSKNLIFATGYSTNDFKRWDFVPLEDVKGQVGIFQAPKSLLNFDHSISSLGYLARLGKSNKFIQGSTYEHDFEDLHTDKEGEKYLRKRMAQTLPALAKKAQLIDQWAGVRMMTPDKKPVVGQHPNDSSLHLFTALGSKGLMYGKFLAEHYADHLKNKTNLFSEILISRF